MWQMMEANQQYRTFDWRVPLNVTDGLLFAVL